MLTKKLYRIIEKYIFQYVPAGYPIDSNPFIIHAIDEFGHNEMKTIIVYEEGKINNNYKKQYIETGISFEKILNFLKEYNISSNNHDDHQKENELYKVNVFDNTWTTNSSIGFIICLQNIIQHTDIHIRILNLNENEMKQIMDLQKNIYI